MSSQQHSNSPAEHESLPESVVHPLSTIENFARDYIASLHMPDNLKSAVAYALLGPGKRVRPLLCWHSFSAIAPKQNPALCLPAAVAVEMVHAFSLVHDDLPGIDNDDLRRGRPTLHKHTNEAMAILAGDSLLTLAFSILCRHHSPALAAQLVSELADGTNAMIVGQVYDTLGGFSQPEPTPEDRLRLIHSNKTGALIKAACRLGALVATNGQTTPHLETITRYAEAIGLMFQIIDDVLDVTQSTDHLGKKAGKDLDAGKLTYPSVLGVEESISRVNQLHQASIAALDPLGNHAEPLRQLADYLARRTR